MTQLVIIVLVGNLHLTILLFLSSFVNSIGSMAFVSDFSD